MGLKVFKWCDFCVDDPDGVSSPRGNPQIICIWLYRCNCNQQSTHRILESLVVSISSTSFPCAHVASNSLTYFFDLYPFYQVMRRVSFKHQSFVHIIHHLINKYENICLVNCTFGYHLHRSVPYIYLICLLFCRVIL